MPSRRPSPCRCGRKVLKYGKCQQCLVKHRQQTDRVRGSAYERGYSSPGHRDFRAEVLKQDRYVCRLCAAAAVVADHYPQTRRELLAAGEDPNDPRFGRALCIECHNRHTGREQGPLRNGYRRY